MDVSSLLDLLPVAVVGIEPDGTRVHLNALARDLLAPIDGAADSAAVRAAIVVEDDEPADVLELALRACHPVQVAVRVTSRRGVLRRRATLSRWGGGAIVAFPVVADEELDAPGSAPRLAALLADTGDIITVLGPDGRIRDANAAAETLTGSDPEAARGMQVLDLVHPDDRPTAEAALAETATRPGVGAPVVVRARFADGEWRVVEAVANNLLDDPAVRGFVLTVRDVTRSALAEHRFRSLIANLSDVIVVLDRDLNITYASPATEHLVGETAEATLGSSALRDVHPGDMDTAIAAFEAALESPRERFEADLRIRHHSGRWRRVLATAVNLLDDPSVGGIVWTLRDVTEEREALERLEELGRMKDQFLTTISHELRTPLAAVNGFAELLRDDPEMPVDQRSGLLERIGRNAQDLHAMVDRLLDHARAMAADHLATEPVDVRTAVDDAVDGMHWALRDHEVRVVVAPGLVVGADREALAHVLRNLLGNAAKFSPRGASVTVTATAEGPEVTIAVADRGPGIPAEVGDRIFEPFFQLEPGISRRGAGVGLAIAKRYTELQGGRIGVRSSPGVGSTFWISLPVAS